MHFKRSLFPLAALAAALLAALPSTTRAVQESGPSRAAIEAGPAYMRALESAASAYAARQFSAALEKLDQADQIHPDISDTWNMRGAIYAEQHAYEKAEDAFQKADRLNPGDFWAPYNIAQLLLMEKKYSAAAAAFQKLEVYRGHEELVQFKIIFTDLLAGNPGDAKPVLDAMKFPCDTAAYYFAHAAWAYAGKDEKEGAYWTHAGVKVFGPAPSIPFYDALAGAGWVPPRDADGSMPEKTELTALPATPPPAGGLTIPAATP